MKKKKLKVVLSEQAKNAVSQMSESDKKSFNESIDNLSEGDLLEAKPLNDAFVKMMEVLEAMGINTFTMEMTKEQERKFHDTMDAWNNNWKIEVKKVIGEIE